MRKLLLLLAVVAIVGCQQPIGPSESPSLGIEVVVGAGGMISRSTDGGNTWSASMGNQVKILDYSAYNMKVNQLQVNGEINQGLIAQVQASSNAIAQLNSVGFLGDAYVRGTLYQQLGQQWVGPIANSHGASNINAVTFGNSVFVAAGDGGKLSRSTDLGATWSALINAQFVAANIKGLAFGNGVFLAVGVGGVISRSTDNGVSWTSIVNSFGATAIASVSYGGGNVFVAVANNGKIGRSFDLGLTWTGIANNFSGASITGVAFGQGIFVAVGAGVGGKISRSTDLGLTWSPLLTNPLTNNALSVAFGNGVFVTGDANHIIARSVDLGLTWGSAITNPFNQPINGITFNFGIFQAVASSGQSARSYDNGVTWGGLVPNPFAANDVLGIASSPQTTPGTGNIVAVGAAGSIATSGWNAVFSSAPRQLYVPTITGFGTVSAVNFSWRQIADMVVVLGGFTSGTSTAVEARISLPNSMVSDASLISSIQYCGRTARTNSAAICDCMIESGVGYITLGVQLGKQNGNVLMNNGDTMSLAFEVPINGLNV